MFDLNGNGIPSNKLIVPLYRRPKSKPEISLPTEFQHISHVSSSHNKSDLKLSKKDVELIFKQVPIVTSHIYKKNPDDLKIKPDEKKPIPAPRNLVRPPIPTPRTKILPQNEVPIARHFRAAPPAPKLIKAKSKSTENLINFDFEDPIVKATVRPAVNLGDIGPVLQTGWFFATPPPKPPPVDYQQRPEPPVRSTSLDRSSE